jgi:hypothetical protein
MGKIHKKLSKGGFVKTAEIGNFKIWCFFMRSSEIQFSKDEKMVFFEISWTVVYAAVEIL